MGSSTLKWILYLVVPCISISCTGKNSGLSKELIMGMQLKRGEVISCGPANPQLGSVNFAVSRGEKVKEEFNLAIKLLHSFEYDEAEKVFAKVIDEEPECAMAYWGVAMSNFHPLWTPPTEAELKKGAKAISIARSISGKTKKEEKYIAAIDAFYKDWDKIDHATRCVRFEKAMQELSASYPDDRESSVFYALALNAAADPADKTYAKQKKAGSILNQLYPDQPAHPGIIHYLIHTYDAPELAEQGLAAARKYASVAPSSAHALHMPSHIFTRMGLWEEAVQSNLASVSSAQCYAESAGINGHWDEELHGLDYLVYAYLQQGDNEQAQRQVRYLDAIDKVEPFNFKVAYAFAAIPSRYVLENKLWKQAAELKIHPEISGNSSFQWQKAILHFTRLLGAARSGDLVSAKAERKELVTIHNNLLAQKDAYKANQLQVQINASDAWILFKEGKKEDALRLMEEACDLEDRTAKHPVTPGEVVPARELLGDLLMEMDQPAKALDAYELGLKKTPNRFNGLYGAGLAAERAGNMEKAKEFYRQLLSIAKPVQSPRPEINRIKAILGGQ